jgi:hypothetical protein
MDAGLSVALRQLHDQLQQAADAATDGRGAAAAVMFAQAGMSLGMYIGHFRATLGPRYPASPESAALNKAAQLLNATIVASYETETDEEEEEQEDAEEDESPSFEAPPQPYGYSPRTDEDDE